MRKKISFVDARDLVRSREQLLCDGLTERELRDRVSSGELVRLHRGFYVFGADWQQLWLEGRHLLRVISVHLASVGRGPIFTHQSAAVLWGIPLFKLADVLAHVLIVGTRHSRVTAGVARHEMSVSDNDIVLRHGIRCTSLERTVFDLARTTSLETSVSAGDAALRSVAIRGHDYDWDAAAEWRDNLERLASAGLRGVKKARWVTEFIDGRAQLPGESVSRLQLFRLGFSAPELQVPVLGSEGDRYFLDFGFSRARVFGEFDGEGKYLEPEFRTLDAPADVLLAEKAREDDVRGVTGWGFARWGHPHIGNAETLGRRLSAFGVFPPG